MYQGSSHLFPLVYGAEGLAGLGLGFFWKPKLFWQVWGWGFSFWKPILF